MQRNDRRGAKGFAGGKNKIKRTGKHQTASPEMALGKKEKGEDVERGTEERRKSTPRGGKKRPFGSDIR